MRISSLVAATALAVIVSAAPVAACFQVRENPAADIVLCGDPRAFVRLDNTESNVPVTFRLVFWSGANGRRVVKDIEVPRYTERMVKRWVKGGIGRKVRVKVSGETLALTPVNRGTVLPWSDPVCVTTRDAYLAR